MSTDSVLAGRLPSPPRSLLESAAITAVIPCYNYGGYLPAAVRAVLEQAAVDARVIIVDDASPDGSGNVAQALADADDRVTVIRHHENLGHIRTYNDGLAQVTTEFVTLVSADDIVAPGAFARAIALMQHHPSVGLVYGPIETFETHPGVHRSSARTWWRVTPGRRWAAAMARRTECEIRSPEAVLRTATLRSVGRYNPDLPRTADMEYWLRVGLGWDIGYVGGATQAFYRLHGSNMHVTEHHDLASMVTHRYRALLPVFAEPFSSHLEKKARRRLAGIALRHVHRKLVRGRWDSDDADAVRAADEIWPQWRTSPRWSHLARSLAEREASGRLRGWTRISGIPLAHLDRVRFRVRGALHRGARA